MPDFTVDVNSNAIVPDQEASKTGFIEEAGAQGHSPESKAAKARVLHKIGRNTVWQVDTETSAESRSIPDDDLEAALMTTLSHQIIRICGPPEDGRNTTEPGGNFIGCAAEPGGNFIGPELEPTELSDQLMEENSLTLIGRSYENGEDADMGVIPDLTTKVGNLPREEHGEQPTNDQPIVCRFDSYGF